jgi:hypothetical protein
MKMTSLMGGLAALALVLGGCGSKSSPGNTKDGGKDAPADVVTQPEVAPDVPADMAQEAPANDAGDAATDAGTDAASDAGTDTATDAGTDAATDAGTDAVAEAPADGGVEVKPPFDAGSGCQAPPQNQAPLVPATEGIPAAGLALWVRADRGIYMTPGGGLLCAWADQSGHDLILLPSGGPPQWRPGTVGGKEGVAFGTTAASMATGGALGIAPTSGRTFVAVVAAVSTTKRFQPVTQGKAGTPGTYVGIDMNTFQTAGSREGVYVTNNAYDSTLATSTAPRLHVFTISTMAPGTAVLPSIDYRVDGVAQSVTRTSGGLGNGNIESIAAADFTSVGSAGGDVIVAEALVYDHALSATERTALETALLARYGIGAAADAGVGN